MNKSKKISPVINETEIVFFLIKTASLVTLKNRGHKTPVLHDNTWGED